MAQFDFTEKIGVSETQETSLHIETIEPINVMTGDKNKARFLYYQLKMSMSQAQRIDIIVSFLMESGVRMILKDLQAALDRGVQICILTGNYLGITQPSASYLIKKELGDQIDLRFYNEKGRSFHPKAYIFHFHNHGEIYIGSSNISKSALTSGIEWNYRFSSLSDSQNFTLLYDNLRALFDYIEQHPIMDIKRTADAPNLSYNTVASESRSWKALVFCLRQPMRHEIVFLHMKSIYRY